MMKSILSCVCLLLVFAGFTEAKLFGNAKAPIQNYNTRQESMNADGLHHVRIAYGNETFCGGSLINDEWILTAGICDYNKQVIFVNHTNLIERRNITEQIYYKDTHNIMLIKVQTTNLKWPTVKLPDVRKCKTPGKGATVEMFAWINAVYDFNTNQDVPQNLQTAKLSVTACASLPVLEKQPVPKKFEKDNENVLCTGHSANNDCELFAGSSLIFNQVLHGVLVNYDFDCKKQIEFKDICKYRKWIQQTTGV